MTRIGNLVDQALDMSRRARMQRAREMGFGARDYFHGSPDLRGVRQGFSPRTIRARNRRTGEFEDLPQATYVTPDQSVARSYADPERAWDYQNAEEGVLPLRVMDEGLLEIDAQGKRFNQLPLERVRDQIPESQRAAFDDLVDQYADPMLLTNEGSMRTGDLEVIANKLGYPGFRIRNVRDTYSGGGRPTEIVAVYDPARFRSPEAAFDPAQRDSSNLLAGVGGAAVGAGVLGAAVAPQEAKAAPFGTLARQLGRRTREGWHGSPYTYDQADLSRMGTGEGAQAYGAGYYAAERRGVADEYRRQLSGTQRFDGEPYNIDDPRHVAAYWVDHFNGDRDRALRYLEQGNEALRELGQEVNTGPADVLRRGEPLPDVTTPEGALYRLEIPDEDLLDWDAPLSEQPAAVRAGIERLRQRRDDLTAQYQASREANAQAAVSRDMEALEQTAAKGRALQTELASLPELPSGDVVGRDLYLALARNNSLPGVQPPGQGAASAVLASVGIPGIRYLDGASRDAGEGTRNYVIFDDANVNVVERNGEPIAAMPRGREEPMSNVARQLRRTVTDASDTFGPGAREITLTDPESGGRIKLLARPDQPNSVLGLYVDEDFRGRGIGRALQDAALAEGDLVGQVSSKAAAVNAYRSGRRPQGQPDATLDDVLEAIDRDSSVNMVTPGAMRSAGFARPGAMAATGAAGALASFLDMRSGKQDTPYKRFIAEGQRAVEQAIGAGESIGNLAASILAEPIAGYAGLVAGPEAVERTRDYFAPQSMSPAAQQQMIGLGNTLVSAGQQIMSGLDAAGQAVGVDRLSDYARYAPGYWAERAVPALQQQFGTQAGSVVGAALRTSPEALSMLSLRPTSAIFRATRAAREAL